MRRGDLSGESKIVHGGLMAKRNYEPILIIPLSMVMDISSQLSGPMVSNAVNTLMGASVGNESNAVLSVPAVHPLIGVGGVIVRFSGGKHIGHFPTLPGTKQPANWQVQWSTHSWQFAQTWISCCESDTANHHPYHQFNRCDVRQRNDEFTTSAMARLLALPRSPHPLPLARSRQRLGHLRCLLPIESLMAVVHFHRTAGEHQRLTRLDLQGNGLQVPVLAGGNA